MQRKSKGIIYSVFFCLKCFSFSGGQCIPIEFIYSNAFIYYRAKLSYD